MLNIKKINIIKAVPNKKNNLFAIAKKIRNTAIILARVFKKFDFIRFKFLVTPQGLEPWTHWLKASYSAN